MSAGRHQPLLEVEPMPDRPGHHRLICGEQRWRAAREVGLTHVMVRIHFGLDHLARLRKQHEENHLRTPLDPIAEAHSLLLDHIIRTALVCERLLAEAGIAFTPLNDRPISSREEFSQHLGEMRRLMDRHGVSAKRGLGPPAPWAETEKAFGISESLRKAKVGLLRLDPDRQEEVRRLSTEQAVQISRLSDPRRQAQLTKRAVELTTRQLRDAVDRLRQQPDLEVDDALAPVVVEDTPHGFEDRLLDLADLCRQLARGLRNMHASVSADERARIRTLLLSLQPDLVAFTKEVP